MSVAMLTPELTRLRRIFAAAGWSGLGLIAIAVMLADFLARAPLGAPHTGPVLAAPSEETASWHRSPSAMATVVDS